MFPSNMRPTILPRASISGLPELPRNHVVVRRNAERGAHVELIFHLHPTVRDFERRRTRRPFERPIKMSEGFDRYAVFHPPGHCAIVQAQREIRIRIDPAGKGFDSLGSDLFGCGADRRFNFVFELLANRRGKGRRAPAPTASWDRAMRPRRASRLATAACARRRRRVWFQR